jgi:N-formylglutamate deformylase
MSVFTFHRGSLPLLVSIPHAGIEVPEPVGQRFTVAGRQLPDTDWYVDQLYAFAADMGASVIKANYSRYVVDLNRSPDSSSLYATNPTSPVCPAFTFGGDEIYRPGEEPQRAEIAERIGRYWQPYHDCIHQEIERAHERHGFALLWDAHSIASEVPGLFAGVLPEFNLGTRDDTSCPPAVSNALLSSVHADGKYSAVLNGRFKGGYITLKYGQPANRIWAVQLELAQRTYMNESSREPFDPVRAHDVTRRIQALLHQYLSSTGN